VSDSPALHSRWPLLIKIEISSNGQNCFILSQNVSKFELYKHNDELYAYTVHIWAHSGLKQSSFGHLKKFLFLVMAAILDTGRR
jgi:hypothetical protein